MNPVSSSGPWTLETMIALPIAGLVVLGAVVGAVAGVLSYRRNRYGYSDGLIFAISSAVVGVVVVGLTAVGMYPYNSEYHQWRDVHGTVQQVSHRLISDGSSMSDRYVLVIDGQPFGVDDTRASLVKVGDSVDLKCKREFQYAANSGWGCNWGGAS